MNFINFVLVAVSIISADGIVTAKDAPSETTKDFEVLSEKTPTADLSPDQVEAIQLLLDLRQDEYFSLPSSNYDHLHNGKDAAKLCPRGGEIAVDEADGNFSEKRIQPEAISIKASSKVNVNAKDCNLLKRRDYLLDSKGNTITDASGYATTEPISDKHKFSVSGSAQIFSGSFRRYYPIGRKR
ncbi:MAG: hypothetical protein JWQ35_2453 [Bacteriovoracaceae bacterium]|nr:hypothetical protein [Bacteriovoracaceae bacterium]